MSIKRLVARGVKLVLNSQLRPQQASESLLTLSTLAALPDGTKLHLAQSALAKMIHEAVCDLRMAEYKAEQEERQRTEKEREAAIVEARELENEKDRAELLSRKPDAAPLTESEADELHDLMGAFCTCTTHQYYNGYRGVKGTLALRFKCVGCFCKGDTPAERRESALAKAEEVKKAYESRAALITAIVDLEAERRAKQILGSIVLMDSDGAMRSIFSFAVRDIKAWHKEAASKELGWKERRKWFEVAQRKLHDSSVETIQDLPVKDLAELAESAQRVWRKKTGAKLRVKEAA